MTQSPGNWPDPERPGVPMFSERDGEHVICTDPEGDGNTVYYWKAEYQVWVEYDHQSHHDALEGYDLIGWAYVGPCFTPAQISEMLAVATQEAEQRVRAEIARDSVKHYPVHYAPVKGQNLSEMQKNVRSHPLYSIGDVRLVWVNEGDLYMPGSAVLVAGDKPAIDAARERSND